MKVLFVLTSHDELGDTGEKNGFWLEEFAAPYYRFPDAGANITPASPAGGQLPLGPKSQYTRLSKTQCVVTGRSAWANTSGSV